MRHTLLQFGYLYNRETSIWSRPNYQGIPYTDGEKVEKRIKFIIDNASDLSTLSDDLRYHCTDWPTRYHLSGSRANILRPLASSLQGDILEIGAGCGAITRFLGECAKNVIALEGSLQRSTIVRARTRDLTNVTVVCDNFNDFQCDYKFDAVTLIGVLEYANLYIPAQNPTLSMLQRARSFLNERGKLIIAIENQLGLKYFSGAREDHVGIPMYGIEARYCPNQPTTFARHQLTNLLKDAGFTYVEILAPFPDYKLPISIITESGFSAPGFDAAALIWQTVHRDHLRPKFPTFSPELTWPSIVKNGLALDLANSFLIIAGTEECAPTFPSQILAWHFATERIRTFCTMSEFVLEGNRIKVNRKRLYPAAEEPVVGTLLAHHIAASPDYIPGEVYLYQLVRIVTRKGWRVEEVCKLLQPWLFFLVTLADKEGRKVDPSSPFSKLPGYMFDYIPQNIILTSDGKFHVIDTEWTATEELELGYIVFRAISSLMSQVTVFARNKEGIFTAYDFVLAIFRQLGWSISRKTVARYVSLERRIQAEVTGGHPRALNNRAVICSLRRKLLPTQSFGEMSRLFNRYHGAVRICRRLLVPVLRC
jgi:hypothetical protein